MTKSVLTTAMAVAIAVCSSAAGVTQSKTRALTIENIYGVTPANGVRQVSIAPDGKLVAITGEGPSGSGVYLVSPSETAPPRFWFQGNVQAWFPDSQRIVFSRDNDLWTQRVGSTEPTRVTSDQGDERAPVVSPDGKLHRVLLDAQWPPGHLDRAERRRRAVACAHDCGNGARRRSALRRHGRRTAARSPTFRTRPTIGTTMCGSRRWRRVSRVRCRRA